MIASRIIDTLHGAGLSVVLTPDNGLKVTPASNLTPELRELIRTGKAALIDWLSAANDSGEPWHVSLAPGIKPETVDRLRAASLALDKAQATTRATPEVSAVVSKPVSAETDSEWWPYAKAMTGPEIDTLTARLDRFVDQGLSLDDSERLADRLAVRDRGLDDRRLCLECQHLRGMAGKWRCGNWQAAGIATNAIDAQLSGELVHRLQRCDGHQYVVNSPIQSNS